MAKFGSWRNGFLEVAGVDMSDHTKEFSVEETANELAHDAHGDEVDQIIPGTFNWTLKGKAYQDFAAASTNKTLRDNYKNRTLVSVRWRADRGLTSATNPMYSGAGYVTQYTGFQGAHGDNMMADFTVRPGAGIALVETVI
jgi:hypothetical protein